MVTAENLPDWHPPLLPFGLCKRDSSGVCIGKCGRPGHLGRPLTIEEWLSFFGPAALNARAKGG